MVIFGINSGKIRIKIEVNMSSNEEPNKHIREIKVTAEASSIEKWRKQVIAGQPETGSAFALISDEGNYMPGGEGTAPTPLTYFVSGMAL
jgi:hypothetical protein